MNETITVNAPVTVPRQRIADTLCAGLEGGVNYWCEGQCTQFTDMPEGVEWAHEAIANDAKFTFKVFEEEDHQNPAMTVAAAVQLMATDHAEDFGNMVGENEDAETGDILFQLICFGEIVYG
jgi:hypothetical protein